jgi:hypothetical protein
MPILSEKAMMKVFKILILSQHSFLSLSGCFLKQCKKSQHWTKRTGNEGITLVSTLYMTTSPSLVGSVTLTMNFGWKGWSGTQGVDGSEGVMSALLRISSVGVSWGVNKTIRFVRNGCFKLNTIPVIEQNRILQCYFYYFALMQHQSRR